MYEQVETPQTGYFRLAAIMLPSSHYPPYSPA